MNFSEMHNRLRLQILRRIQRGTATVSLLSRQTGIGHSHLSNFLNCKRQLSLEAADRVMAAQRISAADLLSTSEHARSMAEESALIPVVSHAAALHEPYIRPLAGRELVHVPERLLRSARAQPTVKQRSWQRFVAITVSADDAQAMSPILTPDALVLLDRHYNSLTPYRSGHPTLYAIRYHNHLRLRYAQFELERLVLQPHNLASPVELIELESDQSPRELVAGRVALVVNEH
jgi:hypothetical protein